MSLSVSVYLLVSGALLLAALVLLAAFTVFHLGGGAFVAVAVLYFLSLIVFGRCTAKAPRPGCAFDYENAPDVQVCAFLCCGGFVLEVAASLLELFGYYSGGYIVFGRAPLLITGAVLALLSGFAMAMTALSFGSAKYDIRRLAFMPFLPLLWALERVIRMLTEYTDSNVANGSFFEVFALVFLLAFFYRFAFESRRREGALPQTVFFSGSLFITGVMLFAGRLFAVLIGAAAWADTGNLFAVSVLLMAVFAFSFARNMAQKAK